MKQFQRLNQHMLKRPDGSRLCIVLFIVQPWLHHFNIPIAKFFPNKIINLLKGDSQLVFIQVLRHFPGKGINLGHNPFVSHGKAVQSHLAGLGSLLNVHHNESGRIPDLIGKVTAVLHTLPIKAHIIAGRIARNQGHAQGICAVLVDDLQGIDAVAQGLAHFPSFGVSYQAVNQHGVERKLSGLLQAGEHHTDNPEENNIISCYQNICGIEIIQILCLFRPAQGREGPEGG